MTQISKDVLNTDAALLTGHVIGMRFHQGILAETLEGDAHAVESLVIRVAVCVAGHHLCRRGRGYVITRAGRIGAGRGGVA